MMSFISVIRSFRVFRMLLLLSKLERLRIIFKIFGITSSGMFDVNLFYYKYVNLYYLKQNKLHLQIGLLVALFLYIYAIFGMAIFGYVKPMNGLTAKFNF